MARKKAAAEQPQEPDVFDEQIAARQAEAAQQAAAQTQVPEGTAHAEKAKPRGPGRGWTDRTTPGVAYRRYTDRDERGNRRIFFKFNLAEGQDVPIPEIIEVMHAHKQTADGHPTGLGYRKDRVQGKVWALPDDPLGRETADRLDMALEKLAHKKEAGQGQGR